MRYQNWDVLLFADQFKVPLQEFKTTCQVIQDPESHGLQLNPLLLPTVTSFIPGLPAGAPFRVSIHAWQNPDMSRYIQTLKKPSDIIVFEARLFIDGRIAGSKCFNQSGPWPTIVDLSVDVDKHGEFEKLKFPTFHKELLSQSYWNPGDDLGRVKVIISEGFSRENQAYPYERIKNIVSFSFQHAPLDVLEASSIAWPNAAMWRQVSLAGPYFAAQLSPRQADGIEAHSHSPRHGQPSRATFAPSNPGSMAPPPFIPKQTPFDPFTEPSNPSFAAWRHASSTDTSMPDYSTSNTRSNNSRQVSDPMQYEKTGRFESIQMPGAFESLCEALIPSAPVNTPDNNQLNNENMAATFNAAASRKASSKMSVDASSVKAEDQPKPVGASALKVFGTSDIKSRKENIQDMPAVAMDLNPVGNENAVRKVSQNFGSAATNSFGTAKPNALANDQPNRRRSQPPSRTSTPVGSSSVTAAGNDGNFLRKTSQPFATTNNSGTKRQRIITPAAAKVIDDEDEPRSSPSIRKASQASTKSTKQDKKENERIVLGGIQNI